MSAEPSFLECPPDITGQDKLKILVLCTGNSARSIMAEALFNSVGADYFKSWSAGSHPTGKVNPYAMEKISSLGCKPEQLSSKSWLAFAHQAAPAFDVVMTVCGNAAAEDCPVFPGNWCHIHWGLPDPAEHMSSPRLAQEAFDECFETLKRRIESVIYQMSVLSDSDPSDEDIVFEKQSKTMLIGLLKDHANYGLHTL